jgi:hypothetical protein
MSASGSLRVRGSLPHGKKSDTDIYITKDSVASSVLSVAVRLLRDHGHVDLHATGATNYRALRLAVSITKSYPQLTADVVTRTIEATDFYVPLTAGGCRESRKRMLNAVDVRISHMQP